MDHSRKPAHITRESLPDHPDLALFVATLFQRLGGRLVIETDGERQVQRPRRTEIDRNNLPQLADAKPWERFHSMEEWQGAIKLAEYWLTRLGPADRDHVFMLLATTMVDVDGAFDFRRQL